LVDEFAYVDADTGKPVSMPGQSSASYVPAGQTQRNDKADLLEKIRPDIVVDIIRHKLMGEEFDEATKKWTPIKAMKQYALTREGAEMIANLMLGVSSQNVSLSSLKDREIKERCLSIAKTAQYLALENWIEFGITRRSQFYFIHEIVFSNSLVVLKQPENEGIRKLLAGTISESRVYQASAPDTSQKKLLGMFRR